MSTETARQQIVLTSPKQGDSLRIDAQYHSVPVTALMRYVNTLKTELDLDETISPIYVLKFRREMWDAPKEKIIGLVFDLLDIRATSNPMSDSFFDLNEHTQKLQDISNVIINNNFFINKFILNRSYMPTVMIVELHNIRHEQNYTSAKTKKDLPQNGFYAWDTIVITDADEIYKDLSLWNLRLGRFENPHASIYNFKYAFNLEMEATKGPARKRSPSDSKQ